MTDRKVTVNETDLLFALDYVPRGRGFHAIARLRAALDALDCTCGRINIGMKVTEHKNWNPDCPVHTVSPRSKENP